MICYVEFEALSEIAILGCNPKHFLHKECGDSWVKHHERKRTPTTCPLFRVKIDVSKTNVVMYKGLDSPNV